MTKGEVIALIKALGGSGGGGSGGGALMVTITQTETGLFLNKTWQEIYDAASTMPVVGIKEDDDGMITHTVLENVSDYEGAYYVTMAGQEYTTDAATGYPEIIY